MRSAQFPRDPMRTGSFSDYAPRSVPPKRVDTGIIANSKYRSRSNLLTTLDPEIGSFSLAAFANDLNATGVWEEAFELATKQTGWWKSIKSPEILLAGSWSLLFGAVVTIISGRMHFLTLMVRVRVRLVNRFTG